MAGHENALDLARREKARFTFALKSERPFLTRPFDPPDSLRRRHRDLGGSSRSLPRAPARVGPLKVSGSDSVWFLIPLQSQYAVHTLLDEPAVAPGAKGVLFLRGIITSA